MAKPIAGINDYPYGVCGFVVDGAFINGSKMKNLRIYKQRSDVMFDLIDPKTDTVYQKLLITGLDTSGEILDYSKTNDQLLNEIRKNTFFVRGYNEKKTVQGFAIRFLLNKIILSTGKTLYDMYTPTCTLPLPDIDNIIIAPVELGDTTISGTLTSSSGAIDPTDMIVTITLPDGSIHTTTVNPDGSFEFTGLVLDTAGTGTITITSPNYNDASATFKVLESGEDSDYVTSIVLSSSDFVNQNEKFSATIPESLHLRGPDIVVQLHSTSGDVFFSTVSVASNGDITVTQDIDAGVDVIIIGKTLHSTPFSTALWFGTSSVTIKQSVHGKSNISFTVYDGSDVVTVDAQINAVEDLTLTSLEEFVGTVVITGKQ